MIVFVITIDLYRTYFLGLESPDEVESEAVQVA